MPHPRFSSAEIVQRGQALYDERIRAQVEASHRGTFLAVDIETGEYEIDAVIIRHQKRAHNPLLMAAGCANTNVPVPWLGGKRLQLVFG